MPPETRKNGCIPEAFRLLEENGEKGRVVWVPKEDHAYLVLNNGATLNLGDNGYPDPQSFTESELEERIEQGLAFVYPIKE